MSNDPVWTDAAALDDLWEGAGIAIAGGAGEVALFRVGEQVFAVDNLCTHGHARLCEGFVEGREVECPLHQGRFDLATGAATCEPAAEALKTYPVRIDGARVWVRLG